MTGIARETLVLRREGFSPSLSLLIPTFAFPCAPAHVTMNIRRTWNAPLPILLLLLSRAFGICLIPDYYPRKDPRPVSCYALFECMAASKPTSWLSGRAHILCHLARPLGPWRAVWAVSLSSAQLSPRALTPGVGTIGIRSLVWVGRR